MRWLSIFLSSLLASATLAEELAFITNQNSSDVSIVDLNTRREIKRISVPGQAAGVAAGAHRFYTVSPDDAVFREFSHKGELCRELALQGGPIALALDEKRGRAFVTDWYEARVFVISLQDWRVLKSLQTGSAPSGVALSKNGRYLVTADRDADQVSVFDAESLNKFGEVSVGERPFGVTFSEDGMAYVTNVGSNSVSVVDPKTLQVQTEIPTGDRPYGVAFAQGKGFVTDQYADQISVFDAQTLSPQTTLEAGAYPEGIDRSGDQSEIYVANWFFNTVSVIDVDSLSVLEDIEVGNGPRAFGLFVRKGSDHGCQDAL